MAVVIFDLDGVLANFNKAFTALTQSLHVVACPTHPDLCGDWEAYAGVLTPQQLQQTWEHISLSSTFWLTLPSLVETAVFEDINRLTFKDDVYFVTHRPGRGVKAQSESWLMRQGLVKRPSVIVSKHKAEVAKSIGADFSLEDKAGNAVAISYMAPACQSFIIDRPYNRMDHTVIGGSVKRVKHVEEFLYVVGS